MEEFQVLVKTKSPQTKRAFLLPLEIAKKRSYNDDSMEKIHYTCFFSTGEKVEKSQPKNKGDKLFDAISAFSEDNGPMAEFYKKGQGVIGSTGKKFVEEMEDARKRERVLFIHADSNKVYKDENCTEEVVYIGGQTVLIRCPNDDEIRAIRAIEDIGGKPLIDEDGHNQTTAWPAHIQPLYREVKLTTAKEGEEYFKEKLISGEEALQSRKELYIKVQEVSSRLYAVQEILEAVSNALEYNTDFLRHKEGKGTSGEEKRKTAEEELDVLVGKEKEGADSETQKNILAVLKRMSEIEKQNKEVLNNTKVTDVIDVGLEKEIKAKIDLCLEKIECCSSYTFNKLIEKIKNDKNADTVLNYLKDKCLGIDGQLKKQKEELQAQYGNKKLFVKSCGKLFNGTVFGIRKMTPEEVRQENEDIKIGQTCSLHGIGLKYQGRGDDTYLKYYDETIRHGLDENKTYYKLITGYREHSEKTAFEQLASFDKMIGGSTRGRRVATDLDFIDSLKEKKKEKKEKPEQTIEEIRKILRNIKLEKPKKERFYVEDGFIVEEDRKIFASPVVNIKTVQTNQTFAGYKTIEFRCIVKFGKIHSISEVHARDEERTEQYKQVEEINERFGQKKRKPDVSEEQMEEVRQYALDFIERAKKTDLPHSYNVDLGIMIIDGKEKVDLIEMNSIYSMGRYSNNPVIM